MKILKSTLESFKENELIRTHKLKINGGLTSEGTPPLELPLDEYEGLDENGDPINVGPRGGGGSNSGASVATLGNTGGNVLPFGGK
jgi:hypothetical protein